MSTVEKLKERSRSSRVRRSFEPDEVLASIRRWAEEYGAPPTLEDWQPSRARAAGRAWRAARFEADTWPSVRVVNRHFGSLGNAIEAAGFPRPANGPRRTAFAAEAEMLDAIRRWTARYGAPPAQADWDPVRAGALGQEWRIARFKAGDWPSVHRVRVSFGSLGAAIRAAGLHAPPQRDRGDAIATRNHLNRRRLAIVFAHAVGEPGPDALAEPLRAVAYARATHDDEALASALTDLAASALAWADELTGAASPVPSDAAIPCISTRR